ncbi:MAG: DUF2490 domain-containing protein [Bacteroidia bacterium]|nr:DUF2490 domain-containing protein [Bacteroidia bacterium]
MFILFVGLSGFAQNRINDAGAWVSIGFNYKVNQNQQIKLMGRIRQYENFTETNSWYTDIGYEYKINSLIKISLHYAFNPTRTRENYFRNFHQYYIRTDFKKFINKYFTLYNRIIFQHTNSYIVDIDDGSKPYFRTDFRERVGVSYHLSSTSNIFLHNEWMYTLSEYPVELRRNRLYTGFEKDINEVVNTKLYFVLQSSFHKRKTPNTNHFIFGFDINFTIN